MIGPSIDLRGVQRIFTAGDGATRALSGIDLNIGPGEFVAITGRSGSGKSTLLNIIGDLDRGYAGSCRVGGVEMRDVTDGALALLRRRTFGYVFQHFGLIPVLTCRENVALPAYYDGVPDTLRRDAAETMLERLGLQHRAARYPETLSGGEQQRVAVARALINDAPIIIADEPTGSLDSASADMLFGMLGNLNRDGRTIILVTHDRSFAERARRVVGLADGRIVTDDLRPVAMPAAVPAPTTCFPTKHRQHVMMLPGRAAEALRIVMRTLERRILQSVLTALGIAVGAASVIALATVGDGARRQVVAQIEALGANLVTISRGPPGVRGGERLVTSLVASDHSAVSALPGVLGHAPEMDGVVSARFRERDFLVTLTGTNEQFPLVRDWPAAAGAFFAADAVQRYAHVAVLGATAARNLFGSQNPVGEYLLINNSVFRVAGVMERKGITTGPGHDRDNQIWVPHTTAGARLFGRTFIERIVIKLEPGADADALAPPIRARMLARHGREDFSVNSLTEVIRTATRAQSTLDYFLAAIAVISLLVGGIGVMNIMLASVNERVREIGIRMAVGASRADVRSQFLAEAVVLCAAGGTGGLVLGIAATHVATVWSGIDARLTLSAVVAATSSALVTGLVFGVVPASRAAAIDAAEAFRRAA